MPKSIFQFKLFTVRQERCAMKVSTDGVLFGAWVRHAGAQRILDIGTGTGLIALIAAQRNSEALVDAVEIDDQAASQAMENVAASPWADRIRVYCMDVRRLHVAEPYDLVLCNPPYYAGYSGPNDARVGVAKHSGELCFADLMRVMGRAVAPNGRGALIIPLSREQELLAEAALLGLHPQRRCVVRYVPHRPPKRVMVELAHHHGPVSQEELTVEAGGPFDLSPEYRTLVADLMPWGGIA